jgi:hypothetical protein
VALDGDGHLRVRLHPGRKLLDRLPRLRRQAVLVEAEEHPVADLDHQVLLAARLRSGKLLALADLGLGRLLGLLGLGHGLLAGLRGFFGCRLAGGQQQRGSK